jgi:hypothetical protein
MSLQLIKEAAMTVTAPALPLRVSDRGACVVEIVNKHGGRVCEIDRKLEARAEYLVHAANAYPKLVEALREVRLIAEAVDRAGDSAIPAAYRNKTLADAVEVANALLREFGEA